MAKKYLAEIQIKNAHLLRIRIRTSTSNSNLGKRNVLFWNVPNYIGVISGAKRPLSPLQVKKYRFTGI